jgi:murein DD-endopeptidase MepM/ murein hydrolase activator NlpD
MKAYNSKKASFFVPYIVVLAFLALIIVFGALYIKYAKITGNKELGERAFSVYSAYLNGENALLYLDQSGEYSSIFAMGDVANSKINLSTDCGTYEDVYLWNTEDKECYPENSTIKRQFANVFAGYLDQYLAQYPLTRFPLGNYEYVIRDDGGKISIYGYAIQNLEFKIEDSVLKKKEEKKNEQVSVAESFSIWPVAGTITTCFGWDSSMNRWHDAVDIAASQGTPVRSIADGKVKSVTTGCSVGDWACSGGYGNNVMIEHKLKNGNKLYSFYGHFSSISVKEGDNVKAGQEIGRIGNTGKSTGPHLHFATHKEAVKFNPERDYSEDPFCYIPKTFEGYGDGGCPHQC